MNRYVYFHQQEKNYLAHHGIKGQKWGIRRYQNEDGSLTEEGRRRYGLSVKEENKYENANLNRRTKGLKKETKHLFNKLSNAQVDIAEELAETREYEDKKKWANNKEFKEDVKDLMKTYQNMKKKYGGFDKDDHYIEKENKLKKKYPEAKELIDGFSPWEHIEANTNLEKIFNKHATEYQSKFDDKKYYYSWLDDVLNNDFYYEPQDFYDEAWTIVSASKADINNELTKKYGQDAVNEILKKGYSSLV